MIEELTINDLGVIASARIEPAPGLTVITGETGAGKTMVLSGLALILGRKADSGAVRPGAEQAGADGRLAIAPDHPAMQIATEAGALLDDGALLVSRTVAATGRSRAYLGGRSVPAGLLSEVGELLITVHGQADQLRLRSTAHQRAALDAFAGHRQILADYASAHQRRLEVQQALAQWDDAAEARAAELAHLRRALEQIRELDLQPGQDAQLRAEAERLGNTEDLRLAGTTLVAALSGGPDGEGPTALDLLAQAQRHVETAAEFDPELATWSEQLAQASALLSDLATDAAGYLAGLDADPQRLDQVHQLRAAIADLARTYLGADASQQQVDLADQLLTFADRADHRIGELTAPGGGREALVAELTQAQARAEELAAQITRGRQQAATAMATAVETELSALAMTGARLHVQLTPRSEPGEHGMEDVQLLLAAHPGAPARPLGRGASGGELSRVMLAIEVALARAQAGGEEPLPVFVFDEVDAGVGGRAAVEVGRRLAELARHTQVIVITHLAQVAAFADKHLVVTKNTDGRSLTNSDIEHVQGSRREAELARMLSGEEDSDAARQHAADLLARTTVQP